jgi:tripartite ATP-independent transporter DctM subunit
VEAITLFGMLVVLLLLGVPVAVALLLSGAISLAMSGIPMNILAERMLGAINSYTLMAVPFFIAAAVIMNHSGVTRHILTFADCLIGHRRGGTAHVNVLASLFFSGMSGSATADVASQGRMLIPRMKAEGYDAPFAAGITSAASIITSIIPPSIVMIIYGAVTNTSIGGLFFAGILPGLMLFLFLIGLVFVQSRIKNYPRGERATWGATFPVFLKALPALLTPIFILGGIRFGVTTPTEAGVMACVYALFLGLFVYRELTAHKIAVIMEEAAVSTAVPMFIIASSAIFGFALSISGFGFLIGDLMRSVTSNPTGFMLVALIFMVVIGLFLESTSALLIFVPMLAPVANSYGIPDIQFGILMILALMLGTVSPPVGLQSFIAADIAGISILKIDVWWAILCMVFVALFVILVPAVTLYLPASLM